MFNASDVVKVVLSFANNYAAKQNEDGSFPAGHNGPYHDEETSVRNTSHAVVLFCNLHFITGSDFYLNTARKSLDYLMNPYLFPEGNTYHCRSKNGKDKCNGLVGQAWVIEALIAGYEAFKNEDYYDRAERLFDQHVFDKKTALWHSREIDGTLLPFDPTFNHQLWFAAAASMLKKTPRATQCCDLFMKKVFPKISLYDNGTLKHNTPMGSIFNYLHLGPFSFFRHLKRRISNRLTDNSSYPKSVGYHGFNLYALAIIKENLPDLYCFANFNNIFTKLNSVVDDEKFLNDLEKSIYGYDYNVSGFEFAYFSKAFINDSSERLLYLINLQFLTTYLNDSAPLAKRAADYNTSLARMYQITPVLKNLIDKKLSCSA